MGRNSEAIESVSAILSLQNVVTILFDDEIELINRKIKMDMMKPVEAVGSLIIAQRSY